MNDVEYLYTDLNTVSSELQSRKRNATLKQEVELYLTDLPSCFQEESKGVLFRNIATPDHEFERFIALTKKTRLSPLIVEYTADKFSTRNEDKICLMKMAIFEKRNTHQEALFHYKTIANMHANDNKKFSEITLASGESLLSFHRTLLEKYAPTHLEIYDLSSWIERNGRQAYEYYKKFFAFFICHAVLFECFVTNNDEAVFENEVILPAFRYVEKKFGLKPLIAPLLPSVYDRYWWCYPNNILEHLEF